MKNNILKESFWSFFGQFISVICIVLGVRVITEYVSPIHYGEYIIFSGICLLIFNTVSGSIFQAFLRIIPEKDDDISYNKSILLSSNIVFLFGFIGLFALLLSVLMESDSLFLIFIFFTYLISEHFVALFKTFMNIKREQKKFAFFQIFISIMRPLLAVLLYIYYENNFISILYGFSLANLFVSFIFFGKNIIKSFIQAYHTKFDLNDFSEFFNFSKPLVFQKIFGWSLSNMDKYIIAFFLGTTTVGQYAPVVSLVSMLYLTASAAIELIFRPYYFKYVGSNRINASKKILKIYALCLFFISIIFITIFFLFSKQIVFLLLGQNFRDYYYLAPMISIGFSFLIFGYLFENICFAYKKTWKVFKIEGIAAITNIVVLPIMIYNFGVNGIPVAIVFTYIIHFMSGFIISMRLLKK